MIFLDLKLFKRTISPVFTGYILAPINQLGEAAGVAAYLALHQNKSISEISGLDVKNVLRTGGSAL